MTTRVLGMFGAMLFVTAACGPDWTAFIPRSPQNGQGDHEAQACTPRPAAEPAQHCGPSWGATPKCNAWARVEPEGAVCSDGSPYKFFVNYSGKSDNVLVMFEPGGACFDYDSCTRSSLGAVNPKGIPDNHMDGYADLNLLRRTDDNPARDWNMVFVSYCTGDVHAGDREANYPDPKGGPALTYRHFGARNTQAVVDFLAKEFKDVPQLLVTGCSAGGTGATQNYALIREAVSGVQCGYLLDDSGPIFSSDGPSKTLHTNSRAAWNLDPLLTKLETILRVPAGEISSDFGRINTALAARYPRDRFALTAFQRDLNYSLYSYAVFDPTITLEQIQADWTTDLLDIKSQYESRANMGYFMPYFRLDNCSHCATIPPLSHDAQVRQAQPWLGADIAEDDTNLHQFIDGLLDNAQPIARDFQKDPTGDFTPDQAAMCLPQR